MPTDFFFSDFFFSFFLFLFFSFFFFFSLTLFLFPSSFLFLLFLLFLLLLVVLYGSGWCNAVQSDTVDDVGTRKSSSSNLNVSNGEQEEGVQEEGEGDEEEGRGKEEEGEEREEEEEVQDGSDDDDDEDEPIALAMARVAREKKKTNKRLKKKKTTAKKKKKKKKKTAAKKKKKKRTTITVHDKKVLKDMERMYKKNIARNIAQHSRQAKAFGKMHQALAASFEKKLVAMSLSGASHHRVTRIGIAEVLEQGKRNVNLTTQVLNGIEKMYEVLQITEAEKKTLQDLADAEDEGTTEGTCKRWPCCFISCVLI